MRASAFVMIFEAGVKIGCAAHIVSKRNFFGDQDINIMEVIQWHAKP